MNAPTFYTGGGEERGRRFGFLVGWLTGSSLALRIPLFFLVALPCTVAPFLLFLLLFIIRYRFLGEKLSNVDVRRRPGVLPKLLFDDLLL